MKKGFLFIWIIIAAIALVGCTVNGEPISVDGIEITSEENVHNLKLGETLQLNALVYPTYITQKFIWSTSNEYVATVNENGLVTAVGGGNVEITATYANLTTVSQKYLIIVDGEKLEVAPTSIEVVSKDNVTTCKVGETIRLTANVFPEDASQKVVWVSSDETIATVTRGVVKPIQVGEVVISAYPNGYENMVDSITLTFEEADEPVYSNDWKTIEYATHEEFMSVADETPLKVSGVVTHINPISKDKVSYFVQNGKDGYYVYSQDNTLFPVELGMSVEIGGFKKTYRGLCEIVNVEYFEELEEPIEYVVSDVNDLDVSKQEVMGEYQCSFVTATAVLDQVTTSTKAYNFTATVNGVLATLRVDPSYSSAEDIAAINALLNVVKEGAEFKFTALVIAYSQSDVTPQLLIVNEKDLDFGEISDEELLQAAAGKLDVTKAVGFSIDTIDLPTSLEGFDVVISWDTASDLIDCATGKVTHKNENETATLVATLTLNGKTIQLEFDVLIEAKDEKVYETIATLDLEDALPANSWGNSETKTGYAEGIVELGTPKHKWMLRNALIAAATNDKYNGTFSIRAQVNSTAETTARIEILEADEYNIVEFAACIYGNDAVGTKVRIEYTFDDGATWEASDNVITLNNTTFEVFRVKLPEGAKRIAIVLVEGSGKRVNFDDIKLMK